MSDRIGDETERSKWASTLSIRRAEAAEQRVAELLSERAALREAVHDLGGCACRTDYTCKHCLLGARLSADPAKSLESRVAEWVRTRIGPEHMASKERAMRLLEESIELAQAEGITLDQVRAQTLHVYQRPTGDPVREASGVAICLLAWCAAGGVTFKDIATAEIERNEAKPLKQIRASLARKADADLVTVGDLKVPDAGAERVARERAALRSALDYIGGLAGNLRDEVLTDRTGPNDAAHRGLMYCEARRVAREWHARLSTDLKPADVKQGPINAGADEYIARLQSALRPFAHYAEINLRDVILSNGIVLTSDSDGHKSAIRYQHFADARAALATEELKNV